MKFLMHLYFSAFLISIFSFFPISAQNIAINEIVGVNSNTIADEFGNYEDWIEIHNYGDEAVNLEGYGLSDNPLEPFRWTFPSVTLPAGGYIIVWASGRDIRPQDGFEPGLVREFYPNISGTNISNLLFHGDFPNNPAYSIPHTGDFDGPVNIGDNYGMRMHGWIKAPETGNYTFWISSDNGGLLSLSTDEDPANIVDIASVSNYTGYRVWDKYTTQQSAVIQLEADQYYYIRALLKAGTGGDHLTVRWQLPSGAIEEPIAASRLFWKGSQLHTNFAISSQGEELVLTSPGGITLDKITPVKLKGNISYGRKPDGTGDWYYFEQPTPGFPNSTQGAVDVLSPPRFSSPGGIYADEFKLSLSHPEPGVTIYYSLDGSDPSPVNLSGNTYQYKVSYFSKEGDIDGELLTQTYRSSTYQEPISVINQINKDFSHAAITTFISPSPAIPRETPLAGTVVRAIAVKDGYVSSEIVSGTYIIRDSPYPVPVIAFAMPEESLFSYQTGIYVPGKTFDDWRTQNPTANIRGSSPANYHNRGMDWERTSNIELFDTDGHMVFNHLAGVRIHGGWTRSHPQKSLRLVARSAYGTPVFKHKFFPDKELDTYKSFLLRGSGNDHLYSFFRDAFMQRLVINRAIDIQHWQPAVTFLNGEYWGILNIRDRNDEHYLHYKYDIDVEKIDLLEFDAVVKTGSNEHYLQMLNYIRSNDLSQQQHFDHVNTMMDTDNFAEYYVTQIYVNNRDWPANNVDYWRYQTPSYDPDAPYGKDGRWRWMLFDLDHGFWPWDYGPDHNMLALATQNSWATEVFITLLNNQQFRNNVINRFADLLNVNFHPDTVIALIDSMQMVYDPIIDDHIARWNRIHSRNSWNRTIEKMREFARQRPDFLKTHINEHFNLDGNYQITLHVASGKGIIRINSITVDNPKEWEGYYFKGVPIELEAIAGKNHQFSHWTGASSSVSDIISINADGDISLQAHFVPATDPVLVAFWAFDEHLPNDTPLLTINDTYHANAPARISYISALEGYPFSSGHSQWRKASMERRNLPTEINYRPEGNKNIPYQDAGLKGLQVKQPFFFNGRESMVILHLPTNGYRDVSFSFAALNEKAADGLLFDYSVDGQTTNWISTHMAMTKIDLTDAYKKYDVNFKDIEAADNNPHFKIRIRFAGENLSADEGRRVTFNNFSLDGVPMNDINLSPELSREISLQNVIEKQSPITVSLAGVFFDPDGDVLSFNAESSRTQYVQAAVDGSNLQLSPLTRGESFITVTASDGISAAVDHTFRVVVHPAAHLLSEGDFSFTSWSNDHPELTFPPAMLFVQSAMADPGIHADLYLPYFIPHNDYHENDYPTLGFPYNNVNRTRITGLGDEGISFINTGRERDLGGALVAINTIGQERVSIKWSAGTIHRNDRSYALRLQYRVGIDGPFKDLIYNGHAFQYEAADDGHKKVFPSVSLPAEAMDQEYVQLQWRYHHLAGDNGARAELQLDDIYIGDFPADPSLGIDKGYTQLLKLYPNPANSFIMVESDTLLSRIEVFTMAGSLLYSHKEESSSIRVPVDFLSGGMYIMRVYRGKEAHVRRFQVHRVK